MRIVWIEHREPVIGGFVAFSRNGKKGTVAEAQEESYPMCLQKLWLFNSTVLD